VLSKPNCRLAEAKLPMVAMDCHCRALSPEHLPPPPTPETDPR
jgi:hypothetical protein